MFQIILITYIFICTVIAQYEPLSADDAARAASYTEDCPQNYWELSGQFEGDIVLTPEQKAQVLSRNGIINSVNHWRDGYLVVEFDPALSSDQYNQILLALDVLRSQTCVNARFRNPGEADYVFITASNPGCYSYIGRIGGKQDLNLQDPGCFSTSTIVHELLHAYGFAHMQSDPMRDSYVWIYWDNIIEDQKYNFEVDNSVSSNGYPYDYDSVMHYSPYAFAINYNSPTILRNREPYYELGNENGPSYDDIEKLKYMYCR